PSTAVSAGILDRVFEVEQGTDVSLGSVGSHEDCPAFEQLAMAFKYQVSDRIQERMARAHERRQGLAQPADQVLLEGDPLVGGQHGLAPADEPVTAPYRRRHMGDLVSARLALAARASQLAEGFEEKTGNEVRL